MPCDDRERWDGGVRARLKREEICVYTQLIHFVVPQKLTQHCKGIMLQFEKKEFANSKKE